MVKRVLYFIDIFVWIYFIYNSNGLRLEQMETQGLQDFIEADAPKIRVYGYTFSETSYILSDASSYIQLGYIKANKRFQH